MCDGVHFVRALLRTRFSASKKGLNSTTERRDVENRRRTKRGIRAKLDAARRCQIKKRKVLQRERRCRNSEGVGGSRGAVVVEKKAAMY